MATDQPIIGVREATSTISVKDREIIVLGGLQENTNSDSNNYFPIFGRLPIIRSILGKSTDDYERTEIIIFIRPTDCINQKRQKSWLKHTLKMPPKKKLSKLI